MKRTGQFWVSPKQNQWKVKSPSNLKASKIFENKKEAVDFGIKLAKNTHSELIVQKKDGTIHIKNSYGKDPKEIKG